MPGVFWAGPGVLSRQFNSFWCAPTTAAVSCCNRSSMAKLMLTTGSTVDAADHWSDLTMPPSSMCQLPSTTTTRAGSPTGPIARAPNVSPDVQRSFAAHHCSDAYDAAVSDARPYCLAASRSVSASRTGTANTHTSPRQYTTVSLSSLTDTACSTHA